MSSSAPVFVRGLSRSGGTFLCTMLDAHPDLAISYELYPNMLLLPEGYDSSLFDEFLEALIRSASLKRVPSKCYPGTKYQTFFIRLERGGVSKAEAEQLVRQAIKRNLRFDSIDGCNNFVEMCCLVKMEKENKVRWGAKMNNRIEQYLKCWPKSKCIDLVRDGRDVAASQIQLGTFGKSIEQIASAWANTHKRFLKFEDTHPRNIKVVKYEDLILDSQAKVEELCDFLEVEYSDRMINYHKEKLTLFKASHISKSKVMNGINSSSVGKWKKVLSEQQVEKFSETAGELIDFFGY